MADPLMFVQGNDASYLGAEGFLVNGEYVPPFYAWHNEYCVVVDANGVTVHGTDEAGGCWYSMDETPLTFVQAVAMLFKIQEIKNTDFIGDFIDTWEIEYVI